MPGFLKDHPLALRKLLRLISVLYNGIHTPELRHCLLLNSMQDQGSVFAVMGQLCHLFHAIFPQPHMMTLRNIRPSRQVHVVPVAASNFQAHCQVHGGPRSSRETTALLGRTRSPPSEWPLGLPECCPC